jgi:hypothetical protein
MHQREMVSSRIEKAEKLYFMVTLALHDLRKGMDGYTKEPLQGPLVGHQAVIYTLLQMRVQQIKEVIFGNAL